MLNACAVSTGFRRAIASTDVPMVTRESAASPPKTVMVSSHGMSETVRSVTQIDPMPTGSADLHGRPELLGWETPAGGPDQAQEQIRWKARQAPPIRRKGMGRAHRDGADRRDVWPC